MKEATFKTEAKSQGYITGTVRQFPEGKISVSIDHASNYTSINRYRAKTVANDIVKANFQHPAVTSFKETKMELVEILKKETAEMKEMYLQKTAERAITDFQYMQNSLKRSEQEWYERYGVELVEKTNLKGEKYFAVAEREYHKKNLYKMRDAKHKMIQTVNEGLPTYQEKQRKKAIAHYEYSTLKLARRIEDKGFDMDKLKVASGKVGVNLEILITDGTKAVRCFTIVAEGEIQTAHYRYLIKDR